MAFFKKRHSTITREQFEGCLEIYFERMREGTFSKVKEVIGGVWPVIIEDMYNDFAPKITPDNLQKMIGDCAEIIVGTTKRLKREGK